MLPRLPRVCHSSCGGIAISPDGSRLIITDARSPSLVVVELPGGQVAVKWKLGESPEDVRISREDKLLAVAVEEGNGISLIETASGKHLAEIEVQGKNPEHAVFSPDSRWIYASAVSSNGKDGTVDAIDTATNTLNRPSRSASDPGTRQSPATERSCSLPTAALTAFL